MSLLNVDEYYEFYLRGKTEPQIRKVIQKLKAEIESLKETVKNPGVLAHMSPSPEVCLSMDLEYLKRAEVALDEWKATHPKPEK